MITRYMELIMPKGVYIRTEKHCRAIKKALNRPDVREKHSESVTGINNPMYGKCRNHSLETIEKQSKSHIGLFVGENHPMFGKHHSKESRQQMVKSHIGLMSGDKHWNWQNGISGEPYSPEFNKLLKRRIFERDGFKCMLCKIEEDLVPHHIDYDKDNSNEKNLITLCNSCNSKVNFNRNFWRMFFPEYNEDLFKN